MGVSVQQKEIHVSNVVEIDGLGLRIVLSMQPIRALSEKCCYRRHSGVPPWSASFSRWRACLQALISGFVWRRFELAPLLGSHHRCHRCRVG